MRRIAAAIAVLVLAVAVLTGCELPAPAVETSKGEVRPAFDGDPTRVSAEGGTVERDGVRVIVPKDATSSHVDVSIGRPLGRTVTGFAKEQFGSPIRIDHTEPLGASVTLRWPASALTAAQASRAFLVRWDEDASAWAPSSEPVQHVNGELVAKVSRFSIVDWATDFGQELGELVGARADPPSCASGLPDWVGSTVASDGGLSAAAALMCFEQGDDDSTLRVRVVNNRTFSQRLTLSAGATAWTSAEQSADGLTVQGVAYSAFHTALDRNGSVLIPPGGEVVAELSRPAKPGEVFVSGTVQVQPVTVLADVVAYSMGQASIGGTDNPVLDALIQVTYECAGKQLLLAKPKDTAAIARAVVEVVGDCAEEVARPDSEFGKRYEDLARAGLTRGVFSAKTVVQAQRAAELVRHTFAVLKVGEVVTYLSDQFATSLVGPLPWSFRARGAQAVLGAWTASCSSTAVDSDRLYRNIASQDQFADTSLDYWQFPGWAKAAAKAVKPLAKCAADYRTRLAAFLPGDWGDARSAEVVAKAIRKLDVSDSVAADALIAALRQRGACMDGCTQTGEIEFSHPTWGAVTLYTFLGESPSSGGFGVVDRTGQVRYVWTTDFMYELEAHGQDKAGNLFIDYNPGRYNGVIVLRATSGGLQDFGSEPASTSAAGQQGRFYESEVVDVHKDGTWEIRSDTNSCTPSCAEGTITSKIYRWNGREFVVR